jgi:hypothetical protein
MSFTRTKKIYGNEYQYLVENKRVNGRVVQKCLKYLGRKSNEPISGFT